MFLFLPEKDMHMQPFVLKTVEAFVMQSFANDSCINYHIKFLNDKISLVATGTISQNNAILLFVRAVF